MNPKFFAEPELFGIHHEPTGTLAGSLLPVLVCPPIGHELTRAHRAVKLLSQALARAGHSVLRFDYRGQGDSAGDSADGGVEAWCEDIAHGLDELAGSSGRRTVSVVGLRLGATLAVRALAEGRATSVTVRRLVLWDPVLRGGDFLRVATDLHSAFLTDVARFPALARSPANPTRAPTGDELVGYSYPPSLRRSLDNLDVRELDPWPNATTAIVSSEPSVDCETLVARLRARGGEVSYQTVEGAPGAWTDYALHELTLRAGRLVPAIVELLADEVV